MNNWEGGPERWSPPIVCGIPEATLTRIELIIKNYLPVGLLWYGHNVLAKITKQRMWSHVTFIGSVIRKNGRIFICIFN